MSLKYHLVSRPDMGKQAVEGARLLYGQVRSLNKINFMKLCEKVASFCNARKGQVELVIDGLTHVMTDYMENGDVIQMGDFGNFRMVAGCSGVVKEEDFDPALFKKGSIVFTPGLLLRQMARDVTFEPMPVVVKEVDKPCDLPHVM